MMSPYVAASKGHLTHAWKASPMSEGLVYHFNVVQDKKQAGGFNIRTYRVSWSNMAHLVSHSSLSEGFPVVDWLTR